MSNTCSKSINGPLELPKGRAGLAHFVARSKILKQIPLQFFILSIFNYKLLKFKVQYLTKTGVVLNNDYTSMYGCIRFLFFGCFCDIPDSLALIVMINLCFSMLLALNVINSFYWSFIFVL